jgi:hypothetical protein
MANLTRLTEMRISAFRALARSARQVRLVIDGVAIFPFRVGFGSSGLGSPPSSSTRIALRPVPVIFNPIGRSFLWLEASWGELLPPPPNDLVQEIGSIVRSRRAPALLTALRLAAILLEKAPTEVVELLLEDVRIGLQYLAEETRYDALSQSLSEQYGDVTLIRLSAAEFLAAFACHAGLENRTVQIWLEGAEREPLRAIKTVLRTVRHKAAKSSNAL